MKVFKSGTNDGIGSCDSGWLGIGFDWNSEGITFVLDEWIEKRFSNISIESCNYDKLEDLMTGVKYNINVGVGWCFWVC